MAGRAVGERIPRHPATMSRAEDLPAIVRVRAFMLLMFFEFSYGWSWNTVDVLRPQIRDALGLTLTQAGSMYTAQGGGALVGAIGFGMLADRIGRRRVLLGIVAGTSIAAAAGALVASYPALLVQRFVLGLFLGANFPVLIGTYVSLFASQWRGKLASLGQGTYSLSIIALGWAYARLAGTGDWRMLLAAGAVPALLASPLILLLIPDDRHLLAWGAASESPGARGRPLAGLFAPALRRTTLLLFPLVSLNFFSYQAFAGWITTLLRDERGWSAARVGALVSWQFAGATVGGLSWGWLSDRFGRRVGAWGFLAGGVAVIAFLLARSPGSLAAAAVAWGFAINASVVWAPWISELYPARLRSTALSIFNWGRIVSMFAPLVTGAIAVRHGLAAAMALAAAGFTVAGLVWLAIPETIGPRRRSTNI